MPGVCATHGEWQGTQAKCPACRRQWRTNSRARRTPEQVELEKRQQREYYHANRTPERLKVLRERTSAYYYADIEKGRAKARGYAAKSRRKLRLEAIEAYGGKCVCCGEAEEAFLEFDHINGGGNAHRREVGSTKQVYVWLKANGYPANVFQLLCANCNRAKERPEGCPHAQWKETDR